ncbi:MAG TPA: hypothetical protein VN673_16420, partial [Clostridia bacterium]|nr:hypothetical protein [Clostridia bacterium]
ITIREDSTLTGESVASAGQYGFEFLYVPYTAQNLIGGYINGATGAKLAAAGNFTIARTAAGTYELTIPGKTAASGTLLLQVADWEDGTSVPMASRAFLSYQYNTTSGKFIIQSRKATSDTVSDLADASFYVVWVDFQNPLSPPPGPRLRARDAVPVTDLNLVNATQANLAVNTDEPEVLVTTVDEFNSGGYVDPISGIPALQSLIGYFVDPRTLAVTRGPFFIMGNPFGAIGRHDVKYNPVSKEYNVAGNARVYEGGAIDLLMIARVKPNSIAGANEPLTNLFVFDGITNTLSYDDVALAVSTQNGNFIVVAEHKFPSPEGEGSVGILFSSTGSVLTPTPARLDLLQGAGDEDDPDVIYMPKKNVFLYISNTDAFAANQLTNRVVGSVIQTTPSANQLQVSGPEQSLGVNAGPTQGHPAALENPFNGEIITAFDTGGNDVPTGQLSFYSVGAGPAYTFTQARPQVPYLSGTGGNPFRHQHPMLDADPTSGVILVGHQARSSTVGYTNSYVFSLYDKNGTPLSSQLGQPYFLADARGTIRTEVNYHNVKYSPVSDSFLAVFTSEPLGGNRVMYLASVEVTSSHLAPPSLHVQRNGNNVELRWPAAAAGFVLESKATLGAGDWTTVPGTPTEDGSNLKVTVPATGANYYRLRQ